MNTCLSIYLVFICASMSRRLHIVMYTRVNLSFHMYKVEQTSHIGMYTGVNMIVLMYKMEKISSLRFERIFKTYFR